MNRFNWQLCLIDEVLTPDSSRYWPADSYAPGRPQDSFDKQIIRDWLADVSSGDKERALPEIPEEIVQRTRDRYIELYERLTGNEFPWK